MFHTRRDEVGGLGDLLLPDGRLLFTQDDPFPGHAADGSAQEIGVVEWSRAGETPPRTFARRFVTVNALAYDPEREVLYVAESGMNRLVAVDTEGAARSVAGELGIERYRARVLPQEKAQAVRELKREGPVAFVGDGLNDAAALLEADLGVVIGAGANVAIEAADLVLVQNDPKDVLGAIALAKASYRKMLQNLFWTIGYNVLALPLAAGVLADAGVLLSPAAGAVLMSASTVIVAANAMLLRRLRLD